MVDRPIPLATGAFLLAASVLLCGCGGESGKIATTFDGGVVPPSSDAGAPVVTLSTRGGEHVHLDSTSVYWSSESLGSVAAVAKTGGETRELYARTSLSDHPTELTIDTADAYWPDMGHSDIRRAPLGGGETEILATHQQDVNGIAVDSTYVYWSLSTAGAIARAPLAGGDVTVIATGLVVPTTLTIRGRNAYVATLGAVDPASPNDRKGGAIVRIPLDGGDVQTLASGLRIPSCVEARDDFVYWVNITDSWLDGSVMRVPLAGGNAEVLAAGIAYAGCIALDSANIYYTEVGNPRAAATGRVLRLPLAGGTPTVLADHLDEAIGIAVDDDSVYWGELNRLAKRAKR